MVSSPVSYRSIHAGKDLEFRLFVSGWVFIQLAKPVNQAVFSDFGGLLTCPDCGSDLELTGIEGLWEANGNYHEYENYRCPPANTPTENIKDNCPDNLNLKKMESACSLTRGTMCFRLRA